MDKIYIDNLDVLVLLSGEVLIKENTADMGEPAEIKRPKKMDKKILRNAKEERRARELSDRRYRKVKHILSVFFILCTLGFFVFLFTAPARVAFWDTVVSWYDENIGWFRDTPEGAPKEIKDKREPAYLPFDAESIVMTESSTNYTLRYDLNNGNKLMIYTQSLLTDGTKWVDHNIRSVKPVYVNGHPANIYVYKNMDEKTLEWNDGEYYYKILLYDNVISDESLLKIAESIK